MLGIKTSPVHSHPCGNAKRPLTARFCRTAVRQSTVAGLRGMVAGSTSRPLVPSSVLNHAPALAVVNQTEAKQYLQKPRHNHGGARKEIVKEVVTVSSFEWIQMKQRRRFLSALRQQRKEKGFETVLISYLILHYIFCTPVQASSSKYWAIIIPIIFQVPKSDVIYHM